MRTLDALRAHKLDSRRRIALGLLPLALAGRPTEKTAIKTILTAVDAGFCLIDTADIYGLDDEAFGYTESLIARAMKQIPESQRPIISTKGGMVRTASGRRADGRPEYLRSACHESLRRLGTESIDLYQVHRPDPDVPFTETVCALRGLLDEGSIRSVGISNVSAAQVTVARTILGNALVAVQNRFSVEDRSDVQVISECGRNDLSYLAWAPLGGIGQGGGLGRRAPVLAQVAARYHVSPQRVALTWLLAQDSHIVPVVGTRTPEHVLDAGAATELTLTTGDLEDLTAVALRE